MAPERFSTLYVRKDYDDGIYPRELFDDKIILGGRAIQPGPYKPLPLEIEQTIPDFQSMSAILLILSCKDDARLFKRILWSAHIRLSIDGKI